METTVLVVGAGPTGLTLACSLLSRGVPVRVVDQARAASVTSRALGLHPRGVEVLDRLGALADLPERAVRVAGVSVNVRGVELARIRVDQVRLASRHRTLLISQAAVEAELRALLARLGGKVEWGHEVVGLTQDGRGGEVSLRHGGGTETVRADWVVGCDGAGSAVRRLGGFGFPGERVVENFLLADVHLDWGLPRDTAATWISPDGVFAAFPLPEPNLWRLVAPYDRAVEADDVLGRLSEILPARTGYHGVRFDGALWTSVFRIHRRLAETYRRGRVLLAGDAAHIHSPFGGQGLNTGIGDADNLGWKLALVAGGRADPALLDTYEAERRPVAAAVLEHTTGLTRLLLGQGRLRRFLRDRVAAPLVNLAPVQRRLARAASQLDTHYRRGPLAPWRFAPWTAGLRPGQRVPDLACRRVDGSATRLHAELRGRWALLGRHEPVAAVVRELLGDEVVLLDRPGEQVWLVRPDAHLGWRGRPDPAKLHRWLEMVLRTGRAG
ncbi:FAD-dependent monooxygenase [Crossiella sp. CA-258035]|uniref:FAD-dependent monooxygenase n=1 Tax=Crossiella sp. CA-258035 TaxID=2981138 RepID=UPI0024BC27F4|nr:FAD-dependent monooxygenase [Crossiella sp. CA-258035]WHT19371.1 FAD-dependent monooxygenase [Crossiella sp. CA-258035]